MGHDRLTHDVAWTTAMHILEVVAPCLREEEQREAFAQFYVLVKAGLECFEIQAERADRRLKPSSN
jgi:hypothetical protein